MRTQGSLPQYLVTALLLLAPGSMPSALPAGTVQVSESAKAISERLTGRRTPTIFRVDPEEWEPLTRLYTAGGGVPLWTTPTGHPNAQARNAIGLLAHASAEGLDPRDYAVEALASTEATLAATSAPGGVDVANFDVALSASVLRYMKHVHLGRVDPRTLGFELQVPAESHDFVAVLHSALARNQLIDAVTQLQPPLVQYRALREVLARYRELARSATFDPLPKAVVRLGDSYAGLPALVERLTALGDLAADEIAVTPGLRYEEPLVRAVERFQLRHGLTPDGVIGPATRTELEVPLARRVRQIELALERLRWLPDLSQGRVVVLNIPMFRFWGWEAPGQSALPVIEMSAVVGRAITSQTPVLMEDMHYVVFRPYWNIPRSIVRDEILPALARSAGYLRQHDMEIVRGPGDDGEVVPATEENINLLSQGILRLRQRPGPRNSLGLVKFMFPNDASVYMHGTPAQDLFKHTRRDFSHGCVRVEDPVALAEWVLRDQPDWTRARIIAAMSGNRPQRVDLAQPIQVVLFYSTAGVMMRDLSVRFAEDIYGHDARLEGALPRGGAAAGN